MELIKICKSVWLKVNCFPERVGVYDTCDSGSRNKSVKGHGGNKHTTGPGPPRRLDHHNAGFSTEDLLKIPSNFHVELLTCTCTGVS